jgi:hypothetical protein
VSHPPTKNYLLGDGNGKTANDTVDITVKNVQTTDATLTLSLDRSKVKVGGSYTANGALVNVAKETGLPGRTITIKTFDSSGNNL